MKKRAVFWMAMGLAMLAVFAGCSLGDGKPEARLALTPANAGDADAVVMIQYASPPGPLQKTVRDKDTIARLAALLETVALQKKSRQEPDPGMIFSVSCEALSFRMSIEASGLRYQDTYYETPPGLVDQLKALFAQAPEAAESPDNL